MAVFQKKSGSFKNHRCGQKWVVFLTSDKNHWCQLFFTENDKRDQYWVDCKNCISGKTLVQDIWPRSYLLDDPGWSFFVHILPIRDRMTLKLSEDLLNIVLNPVIMISHDFGSLHKVCEDKMTKLLNDTELLLSTVMRSYDHETLRKSSQYLQVHEKFGLFFLKYTKKECLRCIVKNMKVLNIKHFWT